MLMVEVKRMMKMRDYCVLCCLSSRIAYLWRRNHRKSMVMKCVW